MTLLDNAKRLRHEMTDAEQRLWYYLRAHRFLAACRTFPLAGRIAHRSWNLTV
ncbi:DUF559 domain-containing protein, partial [Ectopseudomonas oleovorans]|uniref:DUF559 domain-containing protein n=1 Tax=Ectopseudomonas oleovorans TaxID=301 RepID=UPI000D4CCDB6